MKRFAPAAAIAGGLGAIAGGVADMMLEDESAYDVGDLDLDGLDSGELESSILDDYETGATIGGAIGVGVAGASAAVHAGNTSHYRRSRYE